MSSRVIDQVLPCPRKAVQLTINLSCPGSLGRLELPRQHDWPMEGRRLRGQTVVDEALVVDLTAGLQIRAGNAVVNWEWDLRAYGSLKHRILTTSCRPASMNID